MGSDFDNKVAVVTGASSGVGAATAKLLAARGARVVLVGRHKSHLNATAKAIKAGGGSAVTVVTDLCDDGAPEKVRKAVVRSYGSVDVLVHCAGLLEKGALEEVDVESIDRMWRINARAPMLLTKALIPHRRRLGHRVRLVHRGPHRVPRLRPLYGNQGRNRGTEPVPGNRARPSHPCQRRRPRLHIYADAYRSIP
jgi:NADP-dependent 3-hydroxy acid dehydrogenase YdfG